MRIITSLAAVPPDARGAVLAIGNFDGVHRGHRILLERARGLARERNMPFGVLSFEPHPRRLFRPDDPPFRLALPAVKAEILAGLGVDVVFALPFDWAFASIPAERFIADILRAGLGAGHVVVGYDFCFGQLRKGNVDTLKESGLPVTVLEKIAGGDGVALSSSVVRKALRLGDIAAANAALGWEWEIRGIVQDGDKRGRELGFPTANVALGNVLHPAYGVYASRAQIMEDGPDAPWLPAATNIGIRPMFALPVGQSETHILDFERDIYGKTLRVRPVMRLRGEAKFESLDALIAQIGKDCAQARQILAGTEVSLP